MSPFVLDASVALAWCLPDEQDERTDRLLERLKASYAIVPALWPTELANGLLVNERKRRIDSAKSAAFLNLLLTLDVRIAPASLLQVPVLELARSEQLTVYDASYLYLAVSQSLPIATLDAALVRAADASGVTVL